MIHSTVFSQRRIPANVVDINGEPIRRAKIYMGYSDPSHFSNKNGEFRLLKPTTRRDITMVITKKGYQTVRIGDIDTIFHPLTIVMRNSPTIIYGQPLRYTNKDELGFFIVSPQFDFIYPSFNDFESILGKENVDSLSLGNTLGLEYAFVYKRFHFALNHGHALGTGNGKKLDSLKGDYRRFLLGAHFGYNLINSKRLLITPKVGVKWYRHRMINHDRQWSIPLEQYITNRYLDIRFNHLIGFTGVDFNYKFYSDNYGYDYFRSSNIEYYYHNHPQFTWSIGFYGGYAFKLNNKPWVYSGNNRLITDQKVDFNNFNFGVKLSIFINHLN